MAQPQLMQIKLSRFDAQPWGFRLQGGVDFAAPLLVQKVNGGSLAEQAGLLPGDAVLKINDVDVFNLRHKDAQDIVVRSGNNFVITIQRGGSTWRPHVTPTGHLPQPNQNSPYLQTVTKTSLAHKQQDVQHIGSGYNNSARPFVNGGDGSVKSIVNKQYNTPVGIYSDESIAETLSAQAEVLAGGVLGVNFKKNEKEYQPDKSEVLKFLREEETGQSTPAFNNHQYQEPTQQQQQQYQQPQQQYQQSHQQQQHQHQTSATKHVSAPVNTPKPPSTGGLPTGQNICQECERLITGVFVRIKDKNLHVECFKCATCGTSLKNQGYYNFNNKLYCDIHAKLAAMQNPPSGTEGYVPVPIKPNTKLSANTISSALSAHGFNGVSNGNSTPTPAPAPAPPQQEDNADFSLPPPPSPTQLQQFESDSQYFANNSNNHAHPHSSLSSLSSASSLTSSMSSPTPDNYISTLPPPPPPPPLPMPANDATMYINTHKNHDHNGNTKMLQQNENDMNTHNKNVAGVQAPTNTAYNKFLKEYSNKLLTQHTGNNNNNILNNSNNNNNNLATTILTQTNNNNNSPTHNLNNNKIFNNENKQFNGTAKPFTPTPAPTTTTNVAAVSAALANQLKFNPCQVANPLATTAATAIPLTQDNSNTIMSTTIASNEQPIYGQINATNANAATADQPFEYVTLTGNVIRSVVPPGKGVNINYKVNQGYARPFGAAPPAAAPKSPISYPPQTQQWAAPQQQQQAPKPASNPYATLPRSNVGQQEPCLQTNTLSATLPRKPHAATDTTNTTTELHHNSKTADAHNDEATAMLAESIGRINMGDKMNNFMAEAGKIISNMLEARLANNNGQQSLSNSGSSLSLRSNSSSNLSKSPMVMRKRFDLDDFKDIDPTEPVALKPVVAVQNATQSKSKAQPQVPKAAPGTLNADLPAHHPMSKVLDICDNGNMSKRQVISSAAKPAGIAMNANCQVNQFPPPPPPLPAATVPQLDNKVETLNSVLPPTETVVYRNNVEQNNRRNGRGGELSTHAMDRRSYIEPNAQNEHVHDGPAFSISVKALGGPNTAGNTPMSPENEEVVSQLLKDGKRPVCCQCNNEIKKGPFITALGRIWCPEHFICVNANCRRPLQDIGFVEEKGDLYCEYCFEKYLAPTCSKCGTKIKGDCLNAIGKHFHPECFTCGHCGKLFGNTPFFLEDGNAYCEADWNELFTTKCFACGFPVEAGDRWVEALNHNYHSQCFNCSYCKQNLEGQSFYNKGGRPFCKNHAR